MKKIFLALVMMFFQCSFISSLTPQQEVEAYVQNLSQNDKEQLVHFFNKLVEQGYDQRSIEKMPLKNEISLFYSWWVV